MCAHPLQSYKVENPREVEWPPLVVCGWEGVVYIEGRVCSAFLKVGSAEINDSSWPLESQ